MLGIRAGEYICADGNAECCTFKRAQHHLVAAVSERAVQTHGLLYIQILEVSVMIFISRLWLHIPSLSCSHYLLSEAIFDLLPMLMMVSVLTPCCSSTDRVTS